MFDIKNKVAIVTGANTGLGQAICVAYAKAGAKVLGVARRSCEETKAKIDEFGGTFNECIADLPAFKRMTIEEYFKYSSKFYQGNYKGNIDKLISFFNLHQNQAIKSLTYEEKKILSFIDSIFFEPEVLILEDPFSNVSNITSAKMIKAINQLKDNGFSIILSSIKYDELDIADRIYLLNEDGINEYKKPKHDKLVISFNFDEKQESIEELLKNVEAYDIIQSNNKVSFCYDKNINDLLFKLAKIKIFDLKIIPQSIYHLEV